MVVGDPTQKISPKFNDCSLSSSSTALSPPPNGTLKIPTFLSIATLSIHVDAVRTLLRCQCHRRHRRREDAPPPHGQGGRYPLRPPPTAGAASLGRLGCRRLDFEARGSRFPADHRRRLPDLPHLLRPPTGRRTPAADGLFDSGCACSSLLLNFVSLGWFSVAVAVCSFGLLLGISPRCLLGGCKFLICGQRSLGLGGEFGSCYLVSSLIDQCLVEVFYALKWRHQSWLLE